jgi:hypothetical protein
MNMLSNASLGCVRDDVDEIFGWKQTMLTWGMTIYRGRLPIWGCGVDPDRCATGVAETMTDRHGAVSLPHGQI